MPSIDVLDSNKRKIATAELPEALFAREANGPLLHEAIIMQRAGERQGTSSTLRRGEVSGSGKKPWKQKHTGRARAGSLRSPVWRHGGTVFGPKPRNYQYSIPKQKYHRAMQVALSSKLASGDVVVVGEVAVADAKTKQLRTMLSQLGVKSTALVVVSVAGADSVMRAGRNMCSVKVATPEHLNVYDVLKYGTIVIAQSALGRLKEVWA
ncbi:MAG: 50S ribosomal protein L4 [Nitrospiraceae bacterium]